VGRTLLRWWGAAPFGLGPLRRSPSRGRWFHKSEKGATPWRSLRTRRSTTRTGRRTSTG
jgi:hypothetical protein